MNVLQINTEDLRGGAAQVARQLFKLTRFGHTVNLFVKNKQSDDYRVGELPTYITDALNSISPFFSKIFHKNLFYEFRNLEVNIRRLLANDISWYRTSEILYKTDYMNANIIHLHNLHESYFNLSSLIRFSKEKHLIWTLHDMWSITGHCAHSFDCLNYTTTCSHCPQLYAPPTLYWDNTRYLFEHKRKVYLNTRIHVVAPSKWLYDKLDKSILSNQPRYLIYNGVDVKTFFPLKNKIELRKKYHISKDVFVIATAANGGKNNFWKGGRYFDEVVRNLKSNRKILFLNIGARNSIDLMNVRDIKYTNDTNVLNEIYNLSDVYLSTSIAENCPLTILEAMSSGLPVIGFEVGGIPELVTKQGGYLYSVGDISSITNSIIALSNSSNDKNIINSLGIYNSLRAKKEFSEDIMLEKYHELYIKVFKELL